MADEEQLTPRERAERQILTQADWDREEAAGRLTAEQIADRLWRMAMHEFADPGEPAAAAFDEAGFLLSLTAASVAVVDGIKLWICTEDHPPPHVHIKRPAPGPAIESMTSRSTWQRERSVCHSRETCGRSS